MSALLGAADVRRIATDVQLRPTKRWGQNFVIDPNTVRRIVRLAAVQDCGVILEVGPGVGSLTLGLLGTGAHVVAVEIDPRLAQRLPATVSDLAPDAVDRLTVIEANALALSDSSGLAREPEALVANLPYNVAVPVVLTVLGRFPSVRRTLVMVQREVAERLSARPGSRSYGAPSVKAQWFGNVSYAGDVPRQVFWPVPNVDSGLVSIVGRAVPTNVKREEVFRLVDAAFRHRRKQLKSALKGSLPTADVDGWLAAARIEPTRRAEDLALDDFVALAEVSQA